MSRIASKLEQMKTNPKNFFFWDSPAFFEAGKHFGQLYGKPNVRTDFIQGESVIRDFMSKNGWAHANGVVLAAVDEHSPSAMRFLETVDEQSDLVIDASHFSFTYQALPPGQRPSTDEDPEHRRLARPFSSMASRLTYLIGRLSRFDDPQVLVLSYSLDVKWALEMLKRQCKNAKVGMAFFENLWDHRIVDHAGHLKASPVEFIQLDEHIEKFFGISTTHRTRESASTDRSVLDAI